MDNLWITASEPRLGTDPPGLPATPGRDEAPTPTRRPGLPRYCEEMIDYTTFPRCTFCNEVITKPLDPGVWRKVTGWVQSRKQGGANAVRYPSEPIAYAHGICLETERLRGTFDQPGLF